MTDKPPFSDIDISSWDGLKVALETVTAERNELKSANTKLQQQVADNKLFPISGGPAIPWYIMRPHERQCRRNHDQSLAEIESRGGFDMTEAYYILTDQDWPRRLDFIGHEEAVKRVTGIVRERSKDREQIASLEAQIIRIREGEASMLTMALETLVTVEMWRTFATRVISEIRALSPKDVSQ